MDALGGFYAKRSLSVKNDAMRAAGGNARAPRMVAGRFAPRAQPPAEEQRALVAQAGAISVSGSTAEGAPVLVNQSWCAARVAPMWSR